MLGFWNPCGSGKELHQATMIGSALSHHGHEHRCASDNFMPIHRPKNVREEDNEVGKRNQGFAMWLRPWYETLFPFLGADAADLVYNKPAPVKKISQGDVIKVGDLLKLAQVDLDDAKDMNRYEGMVLTIDIHYTNWKEWTWPNAITPAYFYSVSVAPASEFKMMQENKGS